MRRDLGLEVGDQLIFLVEEQRITLLPGRLRSFVELKGSLSAAEPFSVHDQIRETVRRRRGQALARDGAK